VHLDVWSDIACPFCYIGSRKLDDALAERPALEATVQWRAYELLPQLPPEGIPAGQFFEAKFGDDVERAWAHVTALGEEVGLELHLERQATAPNTRLAHRVVWLASQQGLGRPAVDALWSGHFVEGADVGDLDVIVGLLDDHATGVDTAELRRGLADGQGLAEVLEDEATAGRLGFRGVPAFVADGTHALVGAGPMPSFLRLLDQAAGATAV